MYLKCAYCVVIPVGFIVMFDFTKFNEARFISCFAFGYVCFRFWGNDKPSLLLSKIWFFIQPFLFTPIGASLLAKNISASDVGNSIAIIVVSMTIRVATIFVITLKQGFTSLERLLIGASWLGKGTITAILGGVIYTESLNLGEEYNEYKQYGIKIQTCTVLAVLITVPIASMLMHSLAPKALDHEEQVPIVSGSQKLKGVKGEAR